jgi:sialidase-1
MNMRTRNSIRQFAWSDDDGDTWSAPITSPFHDRKYGGGGCEGSTVALPSATDTGVDTGASTSKLVFSTPFAKGRENMTVFVSRDSGATWTHSRTVYSGGAAYSALMPINSTHVGLVYEKDGYKTISYQVLKV